MDFMNKGLQPLVRKAWITKKQVNYLFFFTCNKSLLKSEHTLSHVEPGLVFKFDSVSTIIF